MPIVVTTSATATPGTGASTTCQNIIDSVAQDIRQQLQSTVGSGSAAILMDYVNRVQLQLLRLSQWRFLKSDLKRFLTSEGVTDYWIGTTGSGSIPSSAVDTGLNITDIDWVDRNSVLDRSNFRGLFETLETPLNSLYSYQDASMRPGRPRLWRYDKTSTPYLFNVYPTPDNQNGTQPFPEGVALTTTAGGALSARTYYVKVSFVDSKGGESVASSEKAIYVPANYLLTVKAVAPIFASTDLGVTINRYNVYASTTSEGETLQNVSPTSNVSDWTEPGTGLTTSGASPLTNATIAKMGGYLIEFRYFKLRPQVTAVSDVLVIPDIYKDVVIAGVNVLASKFLNRYQDIQFWGQVFMDGMKGMIRDKNIFPQGPQFMRPDGATVDRQFNLTNFLDEAFIFFNPVN